MAAGPDYGLRKHIGIAIDGGGVTVTVTPPAGTAYWSLTEIVPEGLMPIPADECWLPAQLGLQPGAGPARGRGGG